MTNVFKEASIRMFTYPLRILIIINSIILPILLGIIVYFIFKFKKPIEHILNKAIGIEKYIEDNVHLGIKVITQVFNNVLDLTKDNNITKFLDNSLLPSIATQFQHFCHQNGVNFTIPDSFDITNSGPIVKDIQTTFTNLTHFDVANLQLNKLTDDFTSTLIKSFGIGNEDKFKKLLHQFLKQNITIVNTLTYTLLHGIKLPIKS